MKSETSKMTCKRRFTSSRYAELFQHLVVL